LLELGAELESRDLDRQPLSEEELDELIGARDYKAFLNPRNELYRERKMGEKAPSRAEVIRLMSRNPNLIKRPVAVRGDQVVLGLDE
jgi:arsenate reductase (glutaredoxin)